MPNVIAGPPKVVKPVSVAADVVADTKATINIPSTVATNVSISGDTNRKGLLLNNSSTANCFLVYGDAASTSLYTVKIGPGEYWEMPQPVWVGTIGVTWDAVDGALVGTEVY